MKSRILFAGIAFVLLAGTSSAQGLDAFVGYSLLNGDEGVTGRETDQGWMANFSANLTDHFGLVGDFGGHYSDVDLLEYMGGFRLNGRATGANPFAQAVFGGIRASQGGSSDTYFAMGFGGGVDVRAHDHLSFRIVQFDWIPVQVGDDWETSYIRLGFGLTFNWD
jgi:hypothetical protein